MPSADDGATRSPATCAAPSRRWAAPTAWPVVADASLSGPVSLGGGAHGVALTVDAGALVEALGATVADVTEERA